MTQLGQVFKRKGTEERQRRVGVPLSPRRPRLEPSAGRVRPGRRAATLTLRDEYFETHEAEPTTNAKLRWLLAKATSELGEVRVVDLRPEQVCVWRASLPEAAGSRPRRRYGRS